MLGEEQQPLTGQGTGESAGSLPWLERNRLGIVLLLVVLTAIALGLYALQLRNTAPISITPVQTELRDIRVYITGAVAQPGVYAASSGERVGDVVARAGGLTAAADPVAINLARRTQDEMHIHVPAKGESGQAAASNTAPSPLAPAQYQYGNAKRPGSAARHRRGDGAQNSRLARGRRPVCERGRFEPRRSAPLDHRADSEHGRC